METNNDEDNDAEVIETYTYNTYGDIIEKTLHVEDYSASDYTFHYEYDLSGNVTKITYPSLDIPENINLTTSVLNQEEYSAIESITAGNENGTVLVPDDHPVDFIAGSSITLSAGFETEPGANFSATIETVNPTQPAKEVIYTYNNRGQLISIGTPENDDYYATYTYNIDGSMNTESCYQGSYYSGYEYNSPGWLESFATDNNSTSYNYFCEDLTYQYNGNISRLDFGNDSDDYSYDFTYDNAGRILTADHSDGIDYDYSITSYDQNGNFETLTRGNSSLSYDYEDGTNRVESVTIDDNDPVYYTYTDNGNVNNSPKVDGIEYDIATDMTKKITTLTHTPINFCYDSNNARVLKDVDNHKTLYLHGLGDYPLAEDETDGQQRFYVYGPTGLIAMEDVNGEYFVIKDHLGSTRVILNTNEEVVETYDFDAFGNIILAVVTVDNPYQYTGQEYDDEVDLHNFRARMYDSDLMRFYACDPAEQTASPYLFCGNNPIMYMDMDGLWYISVSIGIVGFNVGDSGIGATLMFAHAGYDWERGATQFGAQVSVGVGFDVGVASASASIGASFMIDSKAGASISANASASASFMGAGGNIGFYAYAAPSNYGWQTGAGFNADYGVDINTMYGCIDQLQKENVGGPGDKNLEEKTYKGDLELTADDFQHPTNGLLRNDPKSGSGLFGAKRTTTAYGKHTGLDLLGTNVYAPMSGYLWSDGTGYNSKGIISGTVKHYRLDIVLQHVKVSTSNRKVYKGELIGSVRPVPPEYKNIMSPHLHLEMHYYENNAKFWYLNPQNYFKY